MNDSGEERDGRDLHDSGVSTSPERSKSGHTTRDVEFSREHDDVMFRTKRPIPSKSGQEPGMSSHCLAWIQVVTFREIEHISRENHGSRASAVTEPIYLLGDQRNCDLA